VAYPTTPEIPRREGVDIFASWEQSETTKGGKEKTRRRRKEKNVEGPGRREGGPEGGLN